MTTYERVLAEMGRFHAALPDLLTTIPGKWVVFRGGLVHSVHDDEDSAYAAGIEAFGVDGGHVVAPVEEVHPIPVTARILFGLA